MTPAQFFSKYAFYAIINGSLSKVPPSITLAQAALESGYGRYATGNNFFGIKADASWNGPTFCSDTLEDYGSGYVTINDCFRKYATPFGSFRDHARFLHENSRYDDLFELPFNDYQAWCYGLKQNGYATAPDYAQKLLNIIDSNNLQKYDVIAEAIRTLVIVAVVVTVVYFSAVLLKKKGLVNLPV